MMVLIKFAGLVNRNMGFMIDFSFIHYYFERWWKVSPVLQCFVCFEIPFRFKIIWPSLCLYCTQPFLFLPSPIASLCCSLVPFIFIISESYAFELLGSEILI